MTNNGESDHRDIGYQDRYVAFVDILGFRDLVEKSSTDKEIVSQLFETMLAISDPSLLAPNYKVSKHIISPEGDSVRYWKDCELAATSFSDSMVLSIEKVTQSLNWLLAAIGVFAEDLLRLGYLVRGGIASGQMIHEHPICLGPAMLKAYHLESSVAKWPRIVISHELYEEANSPTYETSNGAFPCEGVSEGLGSCLCTDDDNTHYLDVLGVRFVRKKDVSIREKLLLVEKMIRSRDPKTDEPDVLEKYICFAQYANRVIAANPSIGLEPIRLAWTD